MNGLRSYAVLATTVVELAICMKMEDGVRHWTLYSISIALIVEWMEAITALGLHKPIANNVLLSTYESSTTETELLFRHVDMQTTILFSLTPGGKLIQP